MTRAEAGEIAAAIKKGLKEHLALDVFMDEDGDVFCIPPGAELIGRYTSDAKSPWIASDLMAAGGDA